MAKIGRNDPCRCGSGQIYKRCCLPRDEAAVAAERAVAPPPEAAPALPPFEIISEDEGLDEASNVVIDLIDAGRLDEAEHAGWSRPLAATGPRGVRGRRAPSGYCASRSCAADFVHARPDDYDAEMEMYLREKAAEFSRPAE